MNVTCVARRADRRSTAPDDARRSERVVDLAAYCRRVHGRHAELTRRRTDDRPMCTVRTDGGLGLRHHLIDARQVCGGQRYRMSGDKLHCAVAERRRRTDPPPRRGEVRTIDLADHCRSAHGRDAFVSRRRTDDRPMCTAPTNRGLGLRHHGIDFARLCGSRRYRVRGERLVCAAAPDRPPNGGQPGLPAAGTVDLGAFCRRAFGKSAIVTHRRTDNQPMCTVRTDGGRGLRHHAIDPERVCGGPRFRIDGDRIHCPTGG